MKRFLLIVSAILPCLASFAQTSAEEFAGRYLLLTSKLGPAGVGIETLLNKWEAAFPEDTDMLCAKFNYYFTKAQRSEVVRKDQPRFMGNQPVISLDDSTGAKVHYFEEVMFDDEMYATATQALDKALKIKPDALDLKIIKISSLLSYEKESPDMALQTINSMIDYNFSTHPAWTYGDKPVDDDFFKNTIQDYCASLFTIGSDSSYEAFRNISERMLSYDSKNTNFLNNIGSYYLVCKKDTKQALKYYNKVLKLSPKDYTAAKNCVLIARRDKNTKLEKKYLPILIKATDDEMERTSYETRLKSMN